MSKTLFWYVTRDLLKVFLLASGVLAGIMSFGGLLRPMAKYGLTGAQAAEMLTYFMPGAQTYSLPIAALFATTLVYGRLSADNELTACRAVGISHLSLAVPAMCLGLVLCLVSILSLSFVVPHFTLKVEKVAFASLAEVVSKSIERNHQIKIAGYVVYARSARILPPEADRPDVETVVLEDPMFCLYAKDPPVPSPQQQQQQASAGAGRRPPRRPAGEKEERLAKPSEFFMAKEAIVELRQRPEGVEFQVELINGTAFPRDFAGGSMGGIGTSSLPPVIVDSPIKENTKFMDLRQLRELERDPTRSREIARVFAGLVRQEQEARFLSELHADLAEQGQATWTHDGRRWRLRLLPGSHIALRTARIDVGPSSEVATPGAAAAAATTTTTMPAAAAVPATAPQPVAAASAPAFVELDVEGSIYRARQLTIRARVHPDGDRVYLQLAMGGVRLGGGPEGAVEAEREELKKPLVVPLPAHLRAVGGGGPARFIKAMLADPASSAAGPDELRRLDRKLRGLSNGVRGELHSRAAFAVAAPLLIVLGCCLGMMFRTGNYLSAFALSAIPALLTIALITTGQHVAENESADNLRLGLTLIWSGNAAVAAIGAGLLQYLRKH